MTLQAVQTALATIPLLQKLDPAHLEICRLPGLSNRNYRIRSVDPALAVDYVLRLPGTGSERYVNRLGEIHNRRQAAQLGLTPELLYADVSTGVQLSVHLPGHSLQRSDLQDPAQLPTAVKLLRRLHRSKAVFQGAWPLFDTLADYLCWADSAWRRELIALQAQAYQLRTELDDKAQALCACHCDPTPTNFYRVSTGQLWLLDWEYSAQAEPAWDLAALAAEAEFDAVQQARLVRLYMGYDDADWQRRIAIYVACLHTLAAAWGAAQVGLGNHQAQDLAAYIHCRLALAWQHFNTLPYPLF